MTHKFPSQSVVGASTSTNCPKTNMNSVEARSALEALGLGGANVEEGAITHSFHTLFNRAQSALSRREITPSELQDAVRSLESARDAALAHLGSRSDYYFGAHPLGLLV